MLFNKRVVTFGAGQRPSTAGAATEIGNRTTRPVARPAVSERSTYEALLEPCWDALWRYAYRTTGNTHDAGDLLSETVLDGFQSFAQFRGDTTFLKWMYRVMSTSRIDMLRRSKRYSTECLETLLEHGSSRESRIADEALDPEKIVVNAVLSEPVQNALCALSEDYRAVVVLADMEELDYSAVSEVLQIPIGTVRSRLHRARSLLRQLLAQYVETQW